MSVEDPREQWRRLHRAVLRDKNTAKGRGAQTVMHSEGLRPQEPGSQRRSHLLTEINAPGLGLRSCAPQGHLSSNRHGLVRRGFAYRVRCKGCPHLGSRPQSNVDRDGGSNGWQRGASMRFHFALARPFGAAKRRTAEMGQPILGNFGLKIAKPDEAHAIFALKQPDKVVF